MECACENQVNRFFACSPSPSLAEIPPLHRQQHHQHHSTEDETSGYMSAGDHTQAPTHRRQSAASSPDMWQAMPAMQRHHRPPLRLPHDEQFERRRAAHRSREHPALMLQLHEQQADGQHQHQQRRRERMRSPHSTFTDATDLMARSETDFSVAK